MRILAIDPGYDRLGVAVLESGDILLYSGCLTTSSKSPHADRLKKVGQHIRYLIKIHQPDMVVLETLFFSTNRKTAMKVAEVRGIILYEAACASCTIEEYSPAEIKIAVTGHGRSSKKQIMTMVPHLIKGSLSKKALDDEYDAVALGLTHLASSKNRELSI